ncbi:MAG: hypothetical protein JEY91_13505 [Spirochaetaceae bacterium]|nr:hypothetical protein [Spirochaetaceae bacterium]
MTTYKNIPIYLFLFFALIVNIFIFNNYRVEDIDDPWSLSFAYNYTHNNYEFDRVYKTEKLGGVAYFGKIYSYLYSSILDIAGWTKLNGHIISSLLVYLSLFFWFKNFTRIGIDRNKIFIILLLMLVFEPYVSMGNKTRSDALAYFFSTLCFFFFMRKNYTLAGFVGMLGLETHPMGVTGFFYCLAYFIWQHKSYFSHKKVLIKSIILFALGILGGVALYLSLHYKTVFNIGGELDHFTRVSGATSNYLFSFFFESKKHRHLADFAIFLTGLLIYIIKKMYKEDKFPLILLSVLMVESFFLPRGNSNYAVFAYPAFLLLLTTVSFSIKKTNLVLLFVFLLMFPQYAYLYKMNYRKESQVDYINEVSTVIPDDGLPIFGSANEWFAYYDRDFFYFYLIDDKPEVKECYLILEDHFRNHPQSIPARYNHRELISEITHNDELIQIYYLLDDESES